MTSRLDRLAGQVLAPEWTGEKTQAAASGKNSITITDNRDGKQYEIAISDNTIRPTELKQIKDKDGKGEVDQGLLTY
jgi:citrate synthase